MAPALLRWRRCLLGSSSGSDPNGPGDPEMLLPPPPAKASPIFYPESDGLPMAENTRQFRWIVTLAGNLGALYRDRLDVFVCGNQFWYPVEGEPETRIAP